LKRGLLIAVATAVLVAIASYSIFPHPTYDRTKLKAVAAESRLLMVTHPIKPPEKWTAVPEGQWPPAIASLRPYSVTVHQWGVDIEAEPFFDGGWGYGVPRNESARRMLTDWCYADAGEGVLWHGPC
jgi:hypothetical protein